MTESTIKIQNPITFMSYAEIRERYACSGKIGRAAQYIISVEIHPDEIRATVGWGCTNDRFKKTFPLSEDGYDDACQWVEAMRIELAKELL